MLRTIVLVLALLHLGPGLAFAIVAFGCDGATPALGNWCGRASISSFGKITVLIWLLLASGYAVWIWMKRSSKASPSAQN